MSTVHVSLTPKLNQFVQDLIDSGLYSNVSEVIREALREKYQSKNSAGFVSNKIAALQQEVQTGLDQASSGKFSKDNLDDILKRVTTKSAK